MRRVESDNQMKKDLAYYMRLPYPVVVEEIPPAEGGGFAVRIPLLGPMTAVADGETIDEAYRNLKEVTQAVISNALKRGIQIPEPEDQSREVEACSGQFIVRVPRELHFKLRQKANQNGVSLNSYCQYLLTESVTLDQVKAQLQDTLEEVRSTSWLIDFAKKDQDESCLGIPTYDSGIMSCAVAEKTKTWSTAA